MVSDTILVNSLSTNVLFNSSVDSSFISHRFQKKIDKPLVPLDDTYLMEVATREYISISHDYPNCCVEIDGENFDVNWLSISVRGFDVILGMY